MYCSPYNPHSQGDIKKFHYTIEKYLGKEFIENGCQPFYFEKCRIKIINHYNNKFHRIIGTLIPYNVKKGKVFEKIPVRIMKSDSFGFYLIKIHLNFNSENNAIKVGEEYVIDIVLLKK